MKKSKIKTLLPNIVLALVFIVGLCIFLYPFASDFINTMIQNNEVNRYTNIITELSTERYDKLIQDAQNYNNSLIGKKLAVNNEEAKNSNYKDILSVDGSGMIGYIKIGKINVKIPIYHGTDLSTLQTGVGHLEGTSFPIGSETEHAVLTGHTGLPSAKLLTDLVELKVGDTFDVIILNKIFNYEIDQILVVEPNDTDNLEIEEGKQYCTIVTCTPYGINSHRLLVRGHITENIINTDITSEATIVNSNILIVAISIPMVLILFIILISLRRKRKVRELQNEKFKNSK